MKRCISIVLTALMILSCCTFTFAATSEAESAANELYSMGLFQGTGKNKDGTPIFDLDKAPTRYEAVTMLVRLLGKESAATAQNWTTPFADVVKWAKPYVGYAYNNSLTNGVSSASYGGDQTVNATQYLTFVLRALNYESGVDFQWNKAWELSDKIGLTDGRYNANTKTFTRGDVAAISRNALQCHLKDSSVLLKDTISTLDPVSTDAHWYKEYEHVPDYGYYFKDHISGTEPFINGYVYLLKAPFDSCKSGYIQLLENLGYSYTGNNARDQHETVITSSVSMWESRLENTKVNRTVYIGRFTANNSEYICVSIDNPPAADMVSYLQSKITTTSKVPVSVLSELGTILADYGDMEQEALTACQYAYSSSPSVAAIYSETARQYNVTMASAAYKAINICKQYKELYDLQSDFVNLWAAADSLTDYTITSQNAYSYARLAASVSSTKLSYYQEAAAQYQHDVQAYS